MIVPAFAGNGFTVIFFDPVTIPQLPPDDVRVSVAVPTNPAGGVQVAFNVVALGENVPPEVVDHVPPVAGLVTLPPRFAETPP